MRPEDERELIRLLSAYRKAVGAVAVAKKELEAKQADLCPVKVGQMVKFKRQRLAVVSRLKFDTDDTWALVYGCTIRKDGTPEKREQWLGFSDELEIINGSV